MSSGRGRRHIERVTTPSADKILANIDALAANWRSERNDRFGRRHLERSDFEALAETGFLRLVVPESHGGRWRSVAETGPIIVDAVQRVASGDQSVALVASMHPAVLLFWTVSPRAPAPHTEHWAEQRSEVFRSALDGHFWGTITSEPGSGGDIFQTKAVAEPIDDSTGRFRLTGAKHFGSGSEVVSYMVTIAKPQGEELPVGFYLDLRRQPWDGSAGMTITRRWDGMGMKATQSHATMLDGVEGVTWGWPGALAAAADAVGTLGLTTFCAVIAAVVDAAMTETENRLAGRALRPYEDVAWSQAQIDHWMLTQALRGMIETITTEPEDIAAIAAVKAKMGMAAAAEAILGNVCRAVGGGAFSASSPFATWYEDVRALGYLRPPWALAFDQLSAARQTQ